MTLRDIEAAVATVADASSHDIDGALAFLEQQVFEVAQIDDRRLLATSGARVQSLLRLLQRRENDTAAAKVQVLVHQLEWAHTRSRVHGVRGRDDAGPASGRTGTLRESVHAFIWSANNPVRPVHIAEALDANLTAVSRALSQLEESGAVEVTKVNGADGRGRWYSPTAASATRP